MRCGVIALVDRNEDPRRPLFGAEKVAEALALDGHGQLLPLGVLGDGNDAVPHVVVDDRVTHLERAIGVAELSASIREANDQNRDHGHLAAWGAGAIAITRWPSTD